MNLSFPYFPRTIEHTVKTICSYIVRYTKEEINWIYFSLVVLLLSGLTTWFYADKALMQSIGGGYDNHSRILNNLALYGGILFGTIALYIPFAKDKSWASNPKFWFAVLFAAAVFSFSVYCYWHKEWLKEITEGPSEIFWMRCAKYIGNAFTIGVPVFIWWFIMDRKNQRLYGMNATNVRPYFTLLAMVLPLIILASFSADFLKQYPQASKTLNVAKIEEGRAAFGMLFEFFYGMNYLITEFFFRGFLILVLSRWLGYGAIIPVAAFYVTIHFGKPLGETISSFFGGIILGVLVLETRSIWGGVIIHLGIAFAMELCAAIAKGGF